MKEPTVEQLEARQFFAAPCRTTLLRVVDLALVGHDFVSMLDQKDDDGAGVSRDEARPSRPDDVNVEHGRPLT